MEDRPTVAVKSDVSPISFSVAARVRSFKFAIRGVRLVLSTQHNARVHLVVAIAVTAAGACFQIARMEWCMIVMAMAGVWTVEAMNTAFEFLCDVASPQFHPMVEKAKDVSAGAVLLIAIGAATIGLIIFVPHIVSLI